MLLICHANTARSVMAQVLLSRMLAERGAAHRVEVRSAGIAPWARDGMLPSLDARLMLLEDGIHLAEDAIASTALARHRELIVQADLIVTMTVHQREMLADYEESRGRAVFTLRELAGETGDVGDPAGQGEEVFRACRDEIKRCLALAMDRVLRMLNGSGEPTG